MEEIQRKKIKKVKKAIKINIYIKKILKIISLIIKNNVI